MKKKLNKLFLLSKEVEILTDMSNKRKIIKFKSKTLKLKIGFNTKSKRIAPFNLFCPKHYKTKRFERKYKQIPNKIYVSKLYDKSNEPRSLKRRSKIYAESLY